MKEKRIDIMNRKDMNQMVRKYEPLVNKITKQFSSKIAMPWDDIKSMAYEGLSKAINDYDETKSKMTFLQYAGFAIRNQILISLNDELRTVKMSSYAQKKAQEIGDEVNFTTVRISTTAYGGDDENGGRRPQEVRLGMYEDAKFGDGDVYEYLYWKLGQNFNKRDCGIFYYTFGLNGCDELMNKEIAKKYKVSEGCVSQRVKKMIDFIKGDDELREMLNNL